MVLLLLLVVDIALRLVWFTPKNFIKHRRTLLIVSHPLRFLSNVFQSGASSLFCCPWFLFLPIASSIPLNLLSLLNSLSFLSLMISSLFYSLLFIQQPLTWLCNHLILPSSDLCSGGDVCWGDNCCGQTKESFPHHEGAPATLFYWQLPRRWSEKVRKSYSRVTYCSMLCFCELIWHKHGAN